MLMVAAKLPEPVVQAVGLVASFDDVAVVGQPIQQCSGHLRVA